MHQLRPLLFTSFFLAACGSGEADSPDTSGGSSGTAGASAGTSAGGKAASGGASGAPGAGSGGSSAGSTSSGGAAGRAGGGSGGATSGTGAGGGTTGGSGGAMGGTGGVSGSSGSGSGGTAGAPPAGACSADPWPESDPAATGPFTTVTETDVGPLAGEGENGEPVPFTIFRPTTLGEAGRCHPVITWGNGTGSSPSLYGVFLRHLASHGFIVIASNSPEVASGDPPPMVAGVTWLLAQNADPESPYYGRIDAAHVGATGHSQGGFATTAAAGDESITTMAPLCGASRQRNLHGPAFVFCGGEDTSVTCDSVRNGFDSITDTPAMFANYLTADHANWVTFRGTTPSPVEATVTAWMRLQLMGDTTLRSWFYGADCKLCTDSAWEIEQKNMD